MCKILLLHLALFVFIEYQKTIGSPLPDSSDESIERAFSAFNDSLWIPKEETRIFNHPSEDEHGRAIHVRMNDLLVYMDKKIDQLEVKRRSLMGNLNKYLESMKAYFNKYFGDLFGGDKKPSKEQQVPIVSENGEKPGNAASQAAFQQDESMSNQKPASIANDDAKETSVEQKDKRDTPAPVKDDQGEVVIAPSAAVNEETAIKPEEQSIKENDRPGKPDALDKHEDSRASASSSAQYPQVESSTSAENNHKKLTRQAPDEKKEKIFPWE